MRTPGIGVRATGRRVLRPRARRQAAARDAYKLCSLLLCYPDEELLAARSELAVLAADVSASLERFCGWWAGEEPRTLQEHYVTTFDLHKRCGLYLSYYDQGDRRSRGVGLLRLKRMYRAGGLPLADGELPDYLPAMLEFAAAAPDGWGEVMLREHQPALELLAAGLRERPTPYADVVDAVCELVGPPSAADRARAAAIAAEGPPTELVGLEPGAAAQMLEVGR
ncbi:MAG: nitrate reductase molybdenum cofactor assembly chaperone [Solirubrobacteraceae bacterium]